MTTDTALVIAIVAVAIGYTVYRIFFKPSCGCDCGGQKLKTSQKNSGSCCGKNSGCQCNK